MTDWLFSCLFWKEKHRINFNKIIMHEWLAGQPAIFYKYIYAFHLAFCSSPTTLHDVSPRNLAKMLMIIVRKIMMDDVIIIFIILKISLAFVLELFTFLLYSFFMLFSFSIWFFFFFCLLNFTFICSGLKRQLKGIYIFFFVSSLCPRFLLY